MSALIKMRSVNLKKTGSGAQTHSESIFSPCEFTLSRILPFALSNLPVNFPVGDYSNDNCAITRCGGVDADLFTARHVAMAALQPHNTPQRALDAAMAFQVNAGAI